MYKAIVSKCYTFLSLKVFKNKKVSCSFFWSTFRIPLMWFPSTVIYRKISVTTVHSSSKFWKVYRTKDFIKSIILSLIVSLNLNLLIISKSK